jgi:Flp pilus assembly pilin Flp
VSASRFLDACSLHRVTPFIALILPTYSRMTGGCNMKQLRKLWTEQDGQDIAEYAVMLAVILVLVVGTIRLVGSNANNVFSAAASSIQ